MIEKGPESRQIERYFWAMDGHRSTQLLSWYDEVKRDLPWRHSKDPYIIWISEIILQQTRVEQGLPYFERFREAFPEVEDLANAEEDEVLKLWEGLGYYSRARNMRAAAKQVVEYFGGEFPSTYYEIIKLKGVGPYTAAAISSIAFGEKRPCIDGNVLRVMSRYLATEKSIDKPKTKKWFEEILDGAIPKDRPGDFNQAMMELGATVCLPKQAKCELCPLENGCNARRLNRAMHFPIRTKKVKKRNRFFIYLMIVHNGETLLKRRPEGDIWQGLYEFPMLEVGSEKELADPTALLSKAQLWNSEFVVKSVSAPFKHVLTHQNIKAVFVCVGSSGGFEISDTVSCKVEELSNFALPRLIGSYLETLT